MTKTILVVLALAAALWGQNGGYGPSTSVKVTGNGVTGTQNVSTFDLSTNLTCTWSNGVCTLTASSTAATAFSAITGATNTTAAMLVGAGASLGWTGTGSVTASGLSDYTVATLPAGVATGSVVWVTDGTTTTDCTTGGGTNLVMCRYNGTAWSAPITGGGFTNPMTTLGDMIYGATSGTATRLPGPTGPAGVPEALTETPSGGLAVAPAWALNTQSVSVPAATYTVTLTDRGNLLDATSTPAAVTLPLISTTGFGQGFFVHIYNPTATAGTLTATSGDTITGPTAIEPYSQETVVADTATDWLVLQGPAYDASGNLFLPAALTVGGLVSTPVVGTNSSGKLVAGTTIHTLGFQEGAPGGTALTTGVVGYAVIPEACTLTGWDITVDAGTATVQTWKIATGTAIPTSANSISTSGVSISTGTTIHSTTLTDFTTTAFAAHDIVAANLGTVSGVHFLNFQLEFACAQ